MGIQIGNLLIPYYGLYILCGIIAASLCGVIQVRRFHLDMDNFILLVASAGLGAIVGAKLLYLFVIRDQIDWGRVVKDTEYFSALMSGGFVYYGGLIGALLCLLLCKKLFRVDVMKYIQCCVPCIPIVHGFGRLGCYGAGCCYGRPWDSAFAKIYENSPFAPNGIGLFPVQLVEAIGCFIIAIILLAYIYSRKGKYGLHLYLVLYAIMRFVLEYARYDDAERRGFLLFSTSQWISLGILVGILTYKFIEKVWRK